VIEASKLEEEAEAVSIASSQTEAPGEPGPAGNPVARERWPYWPAVAILVVGLLVTGVLTWVSQTNYTNNEKRLLQLRGKELAAVLAAAQPGIETPLASAAALADATDGSAHQFTRFATPYIGSAQDRFLTLSLWRAGAPGGRAVATVGGTPQLSASSSGERAFLARAAKSPMLSIIGMAPPFLTRLGYAYQIGRASCRERVY
jgi:hypothetical protein